MIRVAAVQHDIRWENPTANFARLTPWIAAAAGAGCRLVVLSEMFSQGFSMNTERVAEAPGGPSTQFLVDQARQHGVWLAGSIAERRTAGEKPFNTLLLVAPNGEIERYDKIHPFSHAGEDEHYQAGGEWVTVNVEGLRCTLFICYDLRFADEFWATAKDTDAYLVVANWPQARRHHWKALLEARAIENQAYVVGVNRVGEGDGLVYTGDSCILSPLGEPLATASQRETLLLADLDPEEVRRVRRQLPFLADRREAGS